MPYLFSIIVFYIALFGILIMIWGKSREISKGKISFFSRIGTTSDHFFKRSFFAIKKTVGYFNRKTFIALTQWIAFHILLRIRKVYVELKHKALMNPHSRKVVDAVRGRGNIQNHGASFYLRRIASDK